MHYKATLEIACSVVLAIVGLCVPSWLAHSRGASVVAVTWLCFVAAGYLVGLRRTLVLSGAIPALVFVTAVTLLTDRKFEEPGLVILFGYATIVAGLGVGGGMLRRFVARRKKNRWAA